MFFSPSRQPESRRRRIFVKRVSITVFVIAIALLASNSWLTKADPIGAGSSPNAVEPTTTPTAIQSPTAVPVPSASPSSSPRVRNLLEYENGGSVTVIGTDTVREALMTQARNFLLRKWRDRGRGRLVLIPHERGLTVNPLSFFVEPDASGVWRVSLEMPNEDPADFYFVEEIGVDANGQPILNPRPGGPPAVTRALHLKQMASVKHGLVF